MSVRITPNGSELPIEAGSPKDAATIYHNLKGQEERFAELMKKYPAIDAAKTPFQKKLAARRIINQLNGERTDLEKQRAAVDGLVVGMEDFEAWKTIPPVLQKNDCSRLHKIVRWLKRAKKKFSDLVVGEPDDYDWKNIQPFVVQHNWVEAFKNAGDYAEGSFNLPFERCAFELRISGKSVTVLAQQDEGCKPAYDYYAECGDMWVSDDEEKEASAIPAFILAREVIKAISVALDAEVATKTIVRASEKANRRRERDGKEPFYSYHVVSLAHRSRVANPLGGVGGATAQKRLHFRRGHWRHYEKFKTWIRWTLVGNPDLGFIDKEYRL